MDNRHILITDSSNICEKKSLNSFFWLNKNTNFSWVFSWTINYIDLYICVDY